jgi:hypothetical protein
MRGLNRVVTVLAVAALALASSTAWAQHEEQETKAVEAAKAWLALVDAGKYAESWDAAGAMFRAAVAKDQWVKMLQASRTPLGKLVSRAVKTKQYATSLPGAPDGQYVVVQFDTSFESKKNAVETVTPVLEKDGAWRVVGYFIK